MKFRDIEKFIRSGEYEVNVSLMSIERTLADWKDAYGLELNPDFQRGHVWTEEQQISYMEFLLRGGTTARVVYFNSPAFGDGSEELDDTILCVDGLQRLTACLRFLKGEIKALGYYFNEFEDRPSMTMDLRFNVNSLKSKAEILEWYIQFNSGGTVHTKEEIDRVKNMLIELKTK